MSNSLKFFGFFVVFLFFLISFAYIKDNFDKPVVAYIAGRTAPPGKRMGHAGAIITGKFGSAKSKIEAFKKAGIQVADYPDQIADIISRLI